MVKHARASRVSVAPDPQAGHRRGGDRGRRRGFDAGDIRDGGLGLLGMRERIALLDGTLEIESTSGGGNDDRRRGAARRERSAS